MIGEYFSMMYSEIFLVLFLVCLFIFFAWLFDYYS